jgi:secreted Zn-dependent insulinase-like peptidase
MQPNSPSNKVLLHALEKVSFEQFVNFSNSIFNEISVDALIHGNWLEATADKIVTDIRDVFTDSLSNNHKVSISSLDMEKQGNQIIPVELPQHDHAAVIYFPLPSKDLKMVALTMLTNQLLSPVFFQQMRTEKQYGYLVGVGFVPINRYPGVALYIQSPHTLSKTLIEAMEEFISESSQYLSTLTQENWLHVQYGLASQLQEKDNNLRIKSQRFWAAICNKEISFTQKQVLIEIIQNLTLNDVINFIQQHFHSKESADRLTLLSYENNTQRIEMGLKDINDKNIADFIKKCQRKY